MIRTFSTLFICSLFFFTGISSVYADAENIAIPIIGNDTSPRFSAREEKILGENFMAQVRLSLPVSDDPEISDYIQRLGFELVSNSDFQTRHFHFFVINDNVINAFAGPDGYIGVDAGLILTTGKESEIAAVLSHEMAHVVQRHLERSFDKNEKLTLPTAAAILAALVLGAKDINVAEAAILGTIAANYQSQLSFSRSEEMEADNIGMQILAKSDFNPYAMASFFEKLQKATRLNEGQTLEFLQTHPVTVKRIAEARNRASAYKYHEKPPTEEYYLVKAKLRVNLSDDLKNLQHHLKVELKERSYTNRVATLYAYAWTLLSNEEYAKAREIAKKLIKLDRERIQYSILTAEIEIKSGNVDKGLKIYDDALSISPGNSALILYYADALVSEGRPRKALQVLDSIKHYKETPTYYQIKAKAEGDSGDNISSHQMLAEYYYLFGQDGMAIEQLNQAKSIKGATNLQKDIIDARIAEIKEIAKLASNF